jgi:hypothetical protein
MHLKSAGEASGEIAEETKAPDEKKIINGGY